MKTSLWRRMVFPPAFTLAGSLTLVVSTFLLAASVPSSLEEFAAPVPFSDGFDRPDSPDVGNGWLEVSEGLSISGMELRGAPTRSVFQMAVVPTFSSAAQDVAASFARPSNSSPRFCLVLRYQDSRNYYLVSRTSGGSSLVQISRVVNGSETVLATKSLPNPVSNTFFRLEGQANGSTLTLRIDGVQLVSVVDSTFSAGKVGIGLGSLSNTTGQVLRADNFDASGSGGETAPVITSHPSSVTVAVGQSASFIVSANGTQPLTVKWQRDNLDIAGATAATYTLPSAALSDSGASFQAVVTNSIDTVTSSSATLTVIPAGVPTGDITAPAVGTTYSAGDTIAYSGTGTDPEDGTLPTNALTWHVDFHHDNHIDPFVSDTSGQSGSFLVPTVGETSTNVWYRLHLTVRDSTGLTSSSFVDVLPNTVDLAFETIPPGLQVKLDGLALATPAETTSVVGMHRTIGVVSPQTLNDQSYVFSSWSQGGTETQDVQTPTVDTTYIANYVPGDGGFSDGFDRPDSPDVGNGWLEVSEGLSISGMELRGTPTKGVFQMAIVPTFSSALQTVAASFARPNNSAPRFGLVLRYQGPQNYYLVSRQGGGSSLVQISRVLNGSETVLATRSLPNAVANTFFRLEGQANGTTLMLRVDGVQMLSIVDSTFSAGNVGIGLGSLTTTTGLTLRADNFAASVSGGATGPTLALGATPASVAPNGSSALNWSTTDATACSFTSGLSGARPVNGSESTGALTSSTSFGMTCTGSGGSISKSVTVTVETGPTLALGASPANVELDGSSTLTWSTTGATACDFTSGLSGPRDVNGSESTGALTSNTTFGMTCTGPDGSVSKSVTVTVGAQPTALPTADEVHVSQEMVLPSSVRAFVFLVPNESHHQDVTRLISATNGYLLPMKVTLAAGATVSVISADNGHVHSLTIRKDSAQVFATGTLAYGALSAPATLSPGSYVLIDGAYSWIRGEITVSEVPSAGTLLVGGFFLPEKRLADYRTMFPANGFRIESEHVFTYGGTKHVLIIFSTDQDLSQAGPKLQALVKANSYG